MPKEIQTLQEVLWRHSETIPQKIFIHYRDWHYTFRDWREWVERLAGGFKSLGVQPGDPVLLAMGNSPEVYASITALSSLGALPVAVNPGLKVSELQFMVEDLGCNVAVVDSVSLAALREVVNTSSSLGHLLVLGKDSASENAQTPLAVAETSMRTSMSCQVEDFNRLTVQSQPFELVTDVNRPALVLYSATSSGKPMATLVSHAVLAQSWVGMQKVLQLSGEEVCINVLPNYHVFSIVAEYGLMLWLGGTVVLHDGFQPNTALQHLAQYRGSWMCGVPSMFSVFADMAERTGVDLRAFRYGVIGGAPVDPPLLERWQSLTGGTLLQVYGSTEVGVATLERPDRPRPQSSAGLCLPDCQIQIVDEDGAEVEPGSVGEILIQLRHGRAHYWRRPQEEQTAFRDGWFHMGDLGWLDAEGNLYVVGRKKQVILYAGENIYPSEVEPILQEYPGVAEAVLLGLPSATKGEEPVVCIRVEPQSTVNTQDFLRYARARLADYKVPRRVIEVQDFPRAAGGSVRRYDLLQQILRQQKSESVLN